MRSWKSLLAVALLGLNLPLGASAQDVTLTAASAPVPIKTITVTITGTVLHRDGTPAANAAVYVNHPSGVGAAIGITQVLGLGIPNANTDAKGNFSVKVTDFPNSNEWLEFLWRPATIGAFTQDGEYNTASVNIGNVDGATINIGTIYISVE